MVQVGVVLLKSADGAEIVEFAEGGRGNFGRIRWWLLPLSSFWCGMVQHGPSLCLSWGDRCTATLQRRLTTKAVGCWP